MILIKKMLFFGIIIVMGLSLMGDSGEIFKVNNARFYWVTSFDIDSDGTEELVAAGQIQSPNQSQAQAFICLLSLQKDKLTQISRLTFAVKHRNRSLSTRIRNLQIIKNADGILLFSAGRAGEDEDGVGFLHQSQIKNKKLQFVNQVVMYAPSRQYSHGYPLQVTDLDGDLEVEVIYGGFSGAADKDFADIRIFEIHKGRLIEKTRPFKELAIPLRINALTVGDISGDGKPDVVAAGRTKKNDGTEVSAFAWWDGNKVGYQIFPDPYNSRVRAILIGDSDKNGKNELIIGGRIDLENMWLADLSIWDCTSVKPILKDRFCWSSGSKIRLRTLAFETSGKLLIGGRQQHVLKPSAEEWRGFFWRFSLKKGKLIPEAAPIFLDQGMDTRVRHIHVTSSGKIYGAGFVKGKKTPDQAIIVRFKTEGLKLDSKFFSKGKSNNNNNNYIKNKPVGL